MLDITQEAKKSFPPPLSAIVSFVRFDPEDSTIHDNDQRVSNGSHSITELVRISSFKESYFSSSKI